LLCCGVVNCCKSAIDKKKKKPLDNELSDDAASMIADALRCNSTLRQMTLRDNVLEWRGLTALLDAIGCCARADDVDDGCCVDVCCCGDRRNNVDNNNINDDDDEDDDDNDNDDHDDDDDDDNSNDGERRCRCGGGGSGLSVLSLAVSLFDSTATEALSRLLSRYVYSS
jgi:hypothetical protein